MLQLCRLRSDVDAAKADVTKAQKDVEAEKKLKLEANLMLKARLLSVCHAMCVRMAENHSPALPVTLVSPWQTAKPDAASNQHIHLLLMCQYSGAVARAAHKAAITRGQ